MILADRLRGYLLESSKKFAEHGTVHPILEILDLSHKYVFTERTGKMAEDAVAAPEKIAKLITLPAQRTWIEFDGPASRRFGVLTNCPSDHHLASATAIVAIDEGDEIVFSGGGFDLQLGGFELGMDIEDWLLRRYIGGLTLMGAPDLLEKKQVQYHKLNKQRAKKDRPPLSDHEVVDLHLTKYERKLEQEFDREERLAGSEGHTAGHKRRHFVRAHIRILMDGRVTKVRPHFRGDASLGEPPRIYMVRP